MPAPCPVCCIPTVGSRSDCRASNSSRRRSNLPVSSLQAGRSDGLSSAPLQTPRPLPESRRWFSQESTTTELDRTGHVPPPVRFDAEDRCAPFARRVRRRRRNERGAAAADAGDCGAGGKGDAGVAGRRSRRRDERDARPLLSTCTVRVAICWCGSTDDGATTWRVNAAVGVQQGEVRACIGIDVHATAGCYAGVLHRPFVCSHLVGIVHDPQLLDPGSQSTPTAAAAAAALQRGCRRCRRWLHGRRRDRNAVNLAGERGDAGPS